MKLEINVAFELKQLVYLKTDTAKKPRMVVSYWVKEASVRYELSCVEATSWHDEYEIVSDDSAKKIGFKN